MSLTFVILVFYTGILLFASSKWFQVKERGLEEEAESHCSQGREDIFPFNASEFTETDEYKMFLLEIPSSS